MSLFDSLYEKYERLLKEDTNYINSTFVDNIALMLKMLVSNDLLPSPLVDKSNTELSVIEYAQQIFNQEKNTKEISLDTNDQMIPPVKLLLKQDADSESFSVTVVDVNSPEKQKEFKNTMLETIFDDVIEYVKQLTIQGLNTANQAVSEMPPAEGANAQPGSGESALPGVGDAPDQQANNQQPSV